MKQIIPIFFLLITLFSYGQRQNFNSLSIEQGIGLHVPLLPADGISRSKYINFNYFHIGARYMVFRNLGARIRYHYNAFRHQDDASRGVTFNRISGELVYNLRDLFPSLEGSRSFGLLAHGGLGYTTSRRLSDNGKDSLFNLQAGLMPIIKITKGVAFFAEGMLISNIKQNYHFTGANYQDIGVSGNSGIFGTFSIGIIVYLGEYGEFFEHADWD